VREKEPKDGMWKTETVAHDDYRVLVPVVLTHDAVIVNPGAWTHYSWAIRDALAILPVPVVEVHLSEPLEREPWRHHSVVAEIASARFAGMGADGYRAALDWLQERAA